jgi:hypothetical protein
LAWLLAQKPWIVPIPGTRNPDHLNENLGAINVHLTPADLHEIETAFSGITVHGGRMNPPHIGTNSVTTRPPPTPKAETANHRGTLVSAYCRPSRQSTSWIKLGHGRG